MIECQCICQIQCHNICQIGRMPKHLPDRVSEYMYSRKYTHLCARYTCIDGRTHVTTHARAHTRTEVGPYVTSPIPRQTKGHELQLPQLQSQHMSDFMAATMSEHMPTRTSEHRPEHFPASIYRLCQYACPLNIRLGQANLSHVRCLPNRLRVGSSRSKGLVRGTDLFFPSADHQAGFWSPSPGRGCPCHASSFRKAVRYLHRPGAAAGALERAAAFFLRCAVEKMFRECIDTMLRLVSPFKKKYYSSTGCLWRRNR